MPTIHTNDGTTIFYKDIATGPPILALHSWSLSCDMWEYQIPSLVDAGHRVIAPDRRGHGRSDVPGSGYDLDTLADDIATLLVALDLRDVTILAHSMGACEAVRYLSRHGDDRVARAVLVGAMTPHLAGAVGTEFVDAVVADLHADRPAWFRNGVDGYFARPRSGVSQATADHGVATILATPLEVQTACLRTFATTDLTDELNAVSVPTLVIHGDADASAPIELTGIPTSQLVAGSRMNTYEGAPHGLYVTHRAQLMTDLLEFVHATSPITNGAL